MSYGDGLSSASELRRDNHAKAHRAKKPVRRAGVHISICCVGIGAGLGAGVMAYSDTGT